MRRLVFSVADRFNKLPWEVEQLTPDELAYCVAYINVTAREEKKAQQEAKQNAESGGRRSRR